MTEDDIKQTIDDLIGVEPKSCATDRQANEAASWVLTTRQVEAAADELLDPGIKSAFKLHRMLTGQKKSLLEALDGAKARVRYQLANWIASGHEVKGCYTKTSFKVKVIKPDEVPDEFTTREIDTKKLEEWASLTEGKQPIPGCTIEPVHVLYSKETK